MTAKEFDLLRRLIDVGGVRAKELRSALYQMKDAREITSPAGVELTTEAKAKLYDIQQRIIRSALAADDRAMADEVYGARLDAAPTREPEVKACETWCGTEGRRSDRSEIYYFRDGRSYCSRACAKQNFPAHPTSQPGGDRR